MARWLVIFDPTLQSRAGHSRGYDRLVAEQARDTFQRVVVFADPAFRAGDLPEVEVRPIPQASVVRAARWVVARARRRRDSAALPNAAAPGLPRIVHRAWKAFRTRGLAASLGRALLGLRPTAGVEIHVLIQQADLYEILAVRQFLPRAAGAFAQRMTIHLLMRHEPEVTRAGQEDVAAFRDCLAALAEWPAPRCRFHADSERVAARFQALLATDARWQLLPVPVPRGLPVLRARRAGRPRDALRIAMMGSSRMERGFGVLPAVFDDLPGMLGGRPVVLVVQVDRGVPDPRVGAVLRTLSRLAGGTGARGARLELLDGPLSDEDYYSHFAAADLLLAPCLSQKYECSTSGVFVEAVRLGIPVVVMQGTWAAGIVEAAHSRGHPIGVVASGVGAIAGCVAGVAGSLAEFEAGVAGFLASPEAGLPSSIPSLLLAAAAQPPASR